MLLPSLLAGFRQMDGSDFVQAFGAITQGIVAHAGGTQTGATRLKAGVNVISTVASGSDSVMLPKAVAGFPQMVVVVNQGGNDAQVFGDGADQISDHATATWAAAATGVALPTTKTGIFVQTGITSKAWKLVLTG